MAPLDVEGVGRRTQILYLINRRRYCELKEENEDQKRGKES